MKRIQSLLLITVALAIGPGCSTVKQVAPVVAPVTMEAATCLVVSKNPQAAPYVRVVAAAFSAWGTSTNQPPTPDQLRTALENLPHGGLSEASARMVWSGVVTIYATLHASDTPHLVEWLGTIGAALNAGSDCAPQAKSRALTASSPGISTAEAAYLGDQIAAYLRSQP